MSRPPQLGPSPQGGAMPGVPGAATTGLRLDARQRAMLAEMKIPFWWPDVAAQRVPEVASDAAAAHALPSQHGGPVTRLEAAAPAGRAAVDAAALAAPPESHARPDLAQMDWAQLHAAVQVCTACGRCAGRKAPVFVAEPQPRQADWMIVGEPPDEYEEQAGTPFVGSAGQLLDNMLRAVRVARDGRGSAGVRLTPVVKCRPAALHNPTSDELAQCAAFLQREIALTRPRVIVAMGRFAALSLLASDNPELLQLPFGRMRGTVYRSMGVPVVVTYHPSRLLRAPAQKASVWADLCLAQAQAARPSPSPPA
jgi:DNA polymerase